MNRTDFLRTVSQMGIREDAFDLNGGLPNNRLVLDSVHGLWAVYYSERGSEFDKALFTSEAEAIENLLARLAADPTTRTR